MILPINFAIVFLFSLTVHISAQTCEIMFPCSTNVACGCIPLVSIDDVGICGVTSVNCARLTPCEGGFECPSSNQKCVWHSRCGDTPVCYPMSMADTRLCPPTPTTRTTPAISIITEYDFDTTDDLATTSDLTNLTLSTYSSELTINSPINASNYKYYELIQIRVNISGEYYIRSNSSMDTYGCIYDEVNNSPDFTDATMCNDDYVGNQFQLNIYLEAGVSYILEFTTYSSKITGPYIVEVYGEGIAEFYLINVAQKSTTSSWIDSNITDTPGSSVVSVYSSSLSEDSPRYPQTTGHNETINVRIDTSGFYGFRSEEILDGVVYLYRSYFNPSNERQNLIAHNSLTGGNNQFSFITYLEAGMSYVLVVTIYGPYVSERFRIIVSGPATVVFDRVENLEEMATTSSSDSSLVITEYSSELTIASRHFQRPLGHGINFYYEAIQVNAYLNGVYTFTSDINGTSANFFEETTMSFFPSNETLASDYIRDAFGSIYENSFSPETPLLNLIQSDDDAGMNGQFSITQRLQADVSYVLVYTTYSTNTFGSFLIKASGPYYVSFYPLNDI